MNPPPGLVPQGSQNQQPQLSALVATSNPQTQYNTFVGNGPNNLNQPPFMPGPSFPNGSNMVFNALMMQNGLFGIQNMQCQPPNFGAVPGLQFQSQFYNAAQNLNQLAGQQFQGQFNMQGLWPQSFPPNMNQIMCLLQGQMNSQNAMVPIQRILPQQCSGNPFGSSQATPSNNPMFSQFSAAPSCPNNFLLNAVQLQAIDQQRSTSAVPQNSSSQLPPPYPALKKAQSCQEILTEKSGNEVLNANLGSERLNFTPSPQGNWKKGNSQTRFLKPRSDHMTNGRGSMMPFNRNRGNGLRNVTEKPPSMEDNHPHKPRRRLNYTEEEIRQWREARRRNYPTASKIAKKLGERCTNLALNDEDAKARRKQLRDILAKQAELGVEVAELPHNYLSDTENQPCNRDFGNHYRERGKLYKEKGRFQNKFNKRGRASRDNNGRYIKRYKPTNAESPAPVAKRAPTLLQKLLSSDIKKDNSMLLQVLRFITLNSFLEHWPEETLIFPQVTAKDAPFEGDTGVGTYPGTKNGQPEENIGNTKDPTGENVVTDRVSDEDIGSNSATDDSSEEDDSELSDKSEEGEI